MRGEEFVALKEDIRTNGLREPIWLHQGKIIDGRNRFRACQEVGVEPAFREWSGEGSLISFVVSLNLHRRHLDTIQRTRIAEKIAPMFKKEAEAAQAHGQTAPGKTLPAQMQEASAEAAVRAAEAMSVSPRSVYNSIKVTRSGTPELNEAVDAGRISLTAAAKVAALPKEEQVQIVAKGPDEIRKAAKELVKPKAEKKPEVEVNPSEARMYEMPAFSAMTVAVQVDLMLEKISWKDPNALAALDRIEQSVQRLREVMTQRRKESA